MLNVTGMTSDDVQYRFLVR